MKNLKVLLLISFCCFSLPVYAEDPHGVSASLGEELGIGEPLLSGYCLAKIVSKESNQFVPSNFYPSICAYYKNILLITNEVTELPILINIELIDSVALAAGFNSSQQVQLELKNEVISSILEIKNGERIPKILLVLEFIPEELVSPQSSVAKKWALDVERKNDSDKTKELYFLLVKQNLALKVSAEFVTHTLKGPAASDTVPPITSVGAGPSSTERLGRLVQCLSIKLVASTIITLSPLSIPLCALRAI